MGFGLATNREQLIKNATTNHIYMKKLTYKELCMGLNIEPQRGGYRQKQLQQLNKIFNIHEYETHPKTYRVTKPKPYSIVGFCVEDKYSESSGCYVIKCAGYPDLYGETENYLRRFNELKRDKRSRGYAMLLNGGAFYIDKQC